MREYTLIRSARRTLALEIRPGGELVVRAPRFLPRRQIDRAVAAKENWIAGKLAALPPPLPEPGEEQLAGWRKEAERLLPDRAAYWANIMGLHPKAVKIGAARTRWGSCSAGGNVNLSCRLMGKPAEAVDYVIVHELAHLRHMDHSPAFYRLVAQYLPDYKERIQLLKNTAPLSPLPGAAVPTDNE